MMKQTPHPYKLQLKCQLGVSLSLFPSLSLPLTPSGEMSSHSDFFPSPLTLATLLTTIPRLMTQFLTLPECPLQLYPLTMQKRNFQIYKEDSEKGFLEETTLKATFHC